MADIVISEFMDEAAIATLSGRFHTHYDPGLVERPGDLLEIVARAKSLIVRNRTKVSGALLDAALELQCVGRLGVGLDNIDLAECRARGIAVYPAAGAAFASLTNIILTPHIAGLTAESKIRVSAVAAASVLRHLEGAVCAQRAFR